MEKKPTPAPATVRDLIALWPSRRMLGLDLHVGEARIHKWAQTNAIPAKFHRRIIDAAKARGHDMVTAEVLVAIHDELASRCDGTERENHAQTS